MNAVARKWIRRVAIVAQKVGPYVLLELLLPGGTLFAFVLYMSRRPVEQDGAAKAPAGFRTRVCAGLCETFELVAARLRIASAWRGRGRERDGLEALAIAPSI